MENEEEESGCKLRKTRESTSELCQPSIIIGYVLRIKNIVAYFKSCICFEDLMKVSAIVMEAC